MNINSLQSPNDPFAEPYLPPVVRYENLQNLVRADERTRERQGVQSQWSVFNLAQGSSKPPQDGPPEAAATAYGATP